jgi:GTP pyrophosphokinase
MEIEQFLSKLPDAYTRADREQIEKAYRFAEKAHQGQTRANGQPYFSHSVGVANILMEMDAIPEIVAAALLHDVVVDCNVTGKQVKDEFGETIAQLWRMFPVLPAFLTFLEQTNIRMKENR